MLILNPTQKSIKKIAIPFQDNLHSSLTASKAFTKAMKLDFFFVLWLPPLNEKNDVQVQLFVHSSQKEVKIGNEIRGKRKAKEQRSKYYTIIIGVF